MYKTSKRNLASINTREPHYVIAVWPLFAENFILGHCNLILAVDFTPNGSDDLKLAEAFLLD
jgi:hypothetical protein